MAAPPRNRLSPKKLLLTKWTAVQPRQREKHFLVTSVVEPIPPSTTIVEVEIEAVHSRRRFVLPWRDLADGSIWQPGWR